MNKQYNNFKLSLILLIPFGSLIGISILFNVYNDYLKMAASQYNYDYLYICLFRLLEALILFISILVYMKDIQKEMNLTYLFIAHDLSVVQYMSDRVMVMYLGSIVEVADSRTLYEETLHPYTKALLSAIPIADIHVKKKRQILEGEVPSPIHKPTGCPFHNRCPQCMEICKKERPVLAEKGKNGHMVACHLYDGK